MARGPIIFDFINRRAFRDSGSSLAGDLVAKLKKSSTKTRVVKTVEGIPPHVLQPQKK